MSTSQLLPPLYAGWMDALLGTLPSESKATCQSCAMLPKDDSPPIADQSYYSPITKCCTYMPELANYLVGRIVSDDDPDAAEGRRSVEARIDQGLEVTPLGLGRSRLYSMRYDRGHAAFGVATSMECPHHLADGRCGVWRHRESTCATWFCKHERGETSKRFWRRLHDLLASVEAMLSRHCVIELGFPERTLDALFPPRGERGNGELDAAQLDGKVDRRAYESLWGPWLGREREFYRKASELVNPLDWQDVLKIGGAELQLAARLTQAAHARALSTTVPERVRQKQLRVLYTSSDSARVCTYSPIDPLKLPRKLLNVLHHFDGRPTQTALENIASEHQLRVGEAVVRKLVDFGILEEA